MFDITTLFGRACQAAADDLVASSDIGFDEAERIIARVIEQFRLSAVVA